VSGGKLKNIKTKKHRQSSDYQCFLPVGVTGFEPATTRPPGVYFMIYVFCICLIFSMIFIDNQLFNFYKFSSVLMVFTQNVVDLL
jgi:ABC-type multidrug transport system permease subunit